jgi:hypothetical protein
MMTAYAVHRSVAPTPVEAFGLRCWARARLYAEGEIALHDAVDALQAAAVRWRLVATLGQDQVQAMMTAEFRAVRPELR